MPDLSLERALSQEQGGGAVAGLDEVGRGPWAGPVIACAVALPHPTHPTGGLPAGIFSMLDDSKKLSQAARESLFDPLRASLAHGFGSASVAEIDDLNILQASLLAMRRALSALPVPVAGALVDGNRDPGLGIPTRLVVRGDSLAISIAAASILAKVTRDRLMEALGRVHPGYGWDTNMGYGTQAHQQALRTLGVTPEHRKSFAPVRARLQADLNM